MSTIHIKRTHNLDHAQARQSTEEIAQQLKREYDLDYHWEGDTLHFQRSGANGRMEVHEGDIEIMVKLSFLLTPIKGRLEGEINRRLDKMMG
ncbi:MAG: polyhydroxyalkanoic acid system family protein [Candidatus Competibacteraceae bacterium]|nr:polyhydroxyalkanoic acid system family protein [Candidatus Competibacteraceae bacterium]